MWIYAEIWLQLLVLISGPCTRADLAGGEGDDSGDNMKKTIGEFKELLKQKFLKGNKTDPDLVAWRQQTWESIQNAADADSAEKIWVYWKLPGAGDSDNIKVNKYILIFSV